MIRRMLRFGLIFFVVAMLTPVLVRSASHDWDYPRWHEASRAPIGLAPAPVEEPRAVIQVYAARTYGWRGLFAVHSWLVTKEAGAANYRRFDVIGWGGGRKLRENYGAPDGKWYGNTPELLLDLRGPEVARLLPAVHAAIADYPWPRSYRTFPGPNSNSFTAHVARSVPALGLDLPPTAIGKDYRPLADPLGRPPSGRGLQLSLGGLAGVIVSPVEGLEINLLGLSAGLDPTGLALRLPAWGRVGAAAATAAGG